MKHTYSALNLFIATLLASSASASDLSRALENAKNKASDTIETFKEHNGPWIRQKLTEIDNGAKTTLSKIGNYVNTQKAKSEASYKQWLHSAPQEKEKPYVSTLPEADKPAAGRTAYAKINLYFSRWINNAKTDEKFDDVVARMNKSLREDSNLGLADLKYVKDENGNTLLQSLVQAAYEKEKAFAKEEDARALERLADPVRGGAEPTLEDDKSYQLTLSMILYFSDNTDLGGVPNNAGVTPVEWLASQSPRSVNLIKFLIENDKSGESLKKLSEYLQAQKKI